MARPAISINDIPDSVLAGMVRDGCYAQNARFSTVPTDSQFLLVLAVPYGKDEGVDDIPSAIDAFRQLLDCSDWFERNVMVLRLENGNLAVSEHRHEDFEEPTPCS